MDLSSLQPLLQWLTAHPGWSGVAVFVIAFVESLLLVGLLFPGTIIMFGIGTLVAVGVLNLWATLALAAAGAVAGDGISFWLGHHYKDRLRVMWPIRRFPGLMARGEQFFLKHGGKSVLFGRFVGPVRPVLPAVIGMMGMRPSRFITINILSAIAWAPTYTLPGVLFGASMGVASEIATRLTVLSLALVVTLWLTAWVVYRIYAYLQPRGTQILARLLTWGAAHRYAGKVVSSVLDPKQSEARGLAILGVALLSIALLLVTVGHRLLGTQLTLTNNALYHFLQELRVPWADRLMVSFTELGSVNVLSSIAAAVTLWLAWRRVWLAVIHCGIAAAFAAILTIALGWSRAAPLSSLGISWANGPVVMSGVLYGLLAVMVTQGLSGVRRWIPYAVASMLIVTINVSQLYLGVVWLSQVVAGALLALLWVLILGAAYRLHATVPVAPRSLTIIAMVTLIAAASVQHSINYDRDLAHFAPQRFIIHLTATTWWTTQWQTLPTYRIDFEGHDKQPLNVQYSGPIMQLIDQLKTRGWQSPPPLTGRNVLQWLYPAPDLHKLPLLPQAHDGRYDSVRLVRAGTNTQQIVVLRLWSSNYFLQKPHSKLWIGSITFVHATTPMPWLTVPITGKDFDNPLKTLQSSLTGLSWKTVQRLRDSDIPWDGTVILIRSTETME